MGRESLQSTVQVDTCERDRMRDWAGRASDYCSALRKSQPRGKPQYKDCSHRSFELGGNCHALVPMLGLVSPGSCSEGELDLDLNTGTDPKGTEVGGCQRTSFLMAASVLRADLSGTPSCLPCSCSDCSDP